MRRHARSRVRTVVAGVLPLGLAFPIAVAAVHLPPAVIVE
jgi:hypothetical protein